MFISFEGIDFSGKSTQISLLEEYLINQGKKVFVTREPGGTLLAENIRKILLSGEIHDPLTEYLLIAAARRDHVENQIKPKLAAGYYVISDRFFDSSYCYQGAYKKLDTEIINTVKKLSIGLFQPDLTFLIDISVEEIAKRLNRERIEENFYDKKPIEFHVAIKNAFLEIAKNNSERIIILNGNQPKLHVSQSIIQTIEKF